MRAHIALAFLIGSAWMNSALLTLPVSHTAALNVEEHGDPLASPPYIPASFSSGVSEFELDSSSRFLVVLSETQYDVVVEIDPGNTLRESGRGLGFYRLPTHEATSIRLTVHEGEGYLFFARTALTDAHSFRGVINQADSFVIASLAGDTTFSLEAEGQAQFQVLDDRLRPVFAVEVDNGSETLNLRADPFEPHFLIAIPHSAKSISISLSADAPASSSAASVQAPLMIGGLVFVVFAVWFVRHRSRLRRGELQSGRRKPGKRKGQ